MKMLRNPKQTTVTISLSKGLLKAIDVRCTALEMDRSTFIRQICLRELGMLKNSPVISETPAKARR